MFCYKCGAKNNDNAVFCISCGSEIRITKANEINDQNFHLKFFSLMFAHFILLWLTQNEEINKSIYKLGFFGTLTIFVVVYLILILPYILAYFKRNESTGVIFAGIGLSICIAPFLFTIGDDFMLPYENNKLLMLGDVIAIGIEYMMFLLIRNHPKQIKHK